MLMRQAVVAGVDYLDVEVDIADQIPRYGKTKRIISYHNLHEVPEKFELIYEQMCEEDGDIVCSDNAEVTMHAVHRMQKNGRCSGGRQCCRDLAPDETGLAHASDDHPPRTGRDHEDRLREPLVETFLHRRQRVALEANDPTTAIDDLQRVHGDGRENGKDRSAT